MDFIKEQAHAWSTIVTHLLEQPLFCAMNGGSLNGPGSSLKYTGDLRQQLPQLLRAYGVSSMLDAPCGDLTWLRETPLQFLHSYIGMDVEPRLIERNVEQMQHWPAATFVCTNLLTKKRLPKADVILCRDFLAHLPTEYIVEMVQKFKDSGSRYLLASNYPDAVNDYTYDPRDFPWLGYLERPYDLTAVPFGLRKIAALREDCAPSGVISTEHELALFEL